MFKMIWTFRKSQFYKNSSQELIPNQGMMDFVKNGRFYMQISKCIGYHENGLADRISLKNGSLVSQDKKLQTGFQF